MLIQETSRAFSLQPHLSSSRLSYCDFLLQTEQLYLSECAWPDDRKLDTARLYLNLLESSRYSYTFVYVEAEVVQETFIPCDAAQLDVLCQNSHGRKQDHRSCLLIPFSVSSLVLKIPLIYFFLISYCLIILQNLQTCRVLTCLHVRQASSTREHRHA